MGAVRTMGRRGGLRVLPAQVLHRGDAQVVLGLLAQALLGAGEVHAGTEAGAGDCACLRSSASPFWAAIAIGSNSAPMGGE